MPPTWPMIQLFGNSRGQLASTWYLGGSCAKALSANERINAIPAITSSITGTSARLHLIRQFAHENPPRQRCKRPSNAREYRSAFRRLLSRACASPACAILLILPASFASKRRGLKNFERVRTSTLPTVLFPQEKSEVSVAKLLSSFYKGDR